METIILSIQNGIWVAKFSETKVIKLFGTDTITTPFTATAPAQYVVKEIAARNPNCIVSMA